MRATIRDKPDGQITSDFPKSCQPRESKIFRFRSRPNHPHNSACLTADEGRWPSSRTCGEMRWTRELRLTCVARAYGEVVWFGRRGAGAKLRGVYFLRGDGGKRAVLRGEHEVSRKAIAQGRPECSRCPVCSCAVLFAQIARGTAGAASTRSSLCPLLTERAAKMQTSGSSCREIANAYSVVIPRCAIAHRGMTIGQRRPRSRRLEGEATSRNHLRGAWNPNFPPP
jgi:hypothetical protein